MSGTLYISESIQWKVGGETKEEAMLTWSRYLGGEDPEELDMKMAGTEADGIDEAHWVQH